MRRQYLPVGVRVYTETIVHSGRQTGELPDDFLGLFLVEH